MQHHGIAHIQPHMGHAGGVVGADEKHKVAGFGLLRCDRGADVIKALRCQASHGPAGLITHEINPLQSKEVDGLEPPHNSDR